MKNEVRTAGTDDTETLSGCTDGWGPETDTDYTSVKDGRGRNTWPKY